MIPIYTGQTEEELPNVLKNSPNGRYVDEAYPFIWKELHKKGYMSIYLDDASKASAFNYRLKGFSNNTCHHYFKHYQHRLAEILYNKYYKSKKGKEDDFCVGAKKRHRVQLDLLFDFKKIYKKSKNIAIMHYTENSHQTNEKFNWVDNDLYDFLSNGYNNKLFDNTAIFLYSDHGSRFVDKRSSHNRYLEERLPFFSIYLPEKYKLNNPIKYNNLKMNTKLLTSPFDIYSTVRDLTCLDSITNKQFPMRSISLFNKIPIERNCEHIGISDHFCTCVQDWKTESISSSLAVKAAKFTVSVINQIIEPASSQCTELSFWKVISFYYFTKSSSLRVCTYKCVQK